MPIFRDIKGPRDIPSAAAPRPRKRFEPNLPETKEQRALLDWAACWFATLYERPDDAKAGTVFIDALLNGDAAFFRRVIRAIEARHKAENAASERDLLVFFHHHGLSLRQIAAEWFRITGQKKGTNEAADLQRLRQRLRRLGLRGRGKA